LVRLLRALETGQSHVSAAAHNTQTERFSKRACFRLGKSLPLRGSVTQMASGARLHPNLAMAGFCLAENKLVLKIAQFA
jgi:hypothetical protein